jgi:hypothetical protein
LVVSVISITIYGVGGDPAVPAVPAAAPTKAEEYYTSTFSTNENLNGVLKILFWKMMTFLHSMEDVA